MISERKKLWLEVQTQRLQSEACCKMWSSGGVFFRVVCFLFIWIVTTLKLRAYTQQCLFPAYLKSNLNICRRRSRREAIGWCPISHSLCHPLVLLLFPSCHFSSCLHCGILNPRFTALTACPATSGCWFVDRAKPNNSGACYYLLPKETQKLGHFLSRRCRGQGVLERVNSHMCTEIIWRHVFASMRQTSGFIECGIP